MPTPTPTIYVPYAAFDDLVMRGTRAAQMSASSVVPGALYCVTDEGNKIERSNGTIWEAYGSSFNQGVWTNIPYSAGDFTADAGTWTVSSILSNRYTLIGKTCIHNFFTNDSTLTCPASMSHLRVAPPPGITIANALCNTHAMIETSINKDPTGIAFTKDGNQYVQIRRSLDSSIFWPTSTSVSLGFQLIYEVL